eukprot:976144_1
MHLRIYLEICAVVFIVVPTLVQCPCVIDGHNDLASQFRDRGYDMASLPLLSNLSSMGIHTDIPRLRQGQLCGQFWSVFVSCELQGKNAVAATLEQIDMVYRMASHYPDTFEIVGTVAEMRQVIAAGKVASLLGVEGGHQIDSSLGVLRAFYRLGARYMTLTHNCATPWSDSQAEEVHGGLTDFGRNVVLEMNRMGMMVDLSHTSYKTMLDAVQVSEAPVIFSHSDCYALVQIERNARDDVMKSVSQKGGIMMINFYPGFVTGDPYNATVADVVRHINHAVQVMGVDHVGIGADFDGIQTLPRGLEDVSKYPALAQELRRQFYAEDDIEKIFNGNILRVLESVELVAKKLQELSSESSAYLNYSTQCRIPLTE